jgi:putative flavoprotein involved in K+ transport
MTFRSRDVARAAGMFAATSFWRDLISFTWNITTVENPAGVSDVLTETLERTDPSSFAVEEPPEDADGVTTAWFTFETAVGRGHGLLRLVEEDGTAKAWTFLTTLYELKGYEEPRGPRVPSTG